ncbi:MAG: restriction endonuclease subunit S [Ignavibacteriaceae bacterium]
MEIPNKNKYLLTELIPKDWEVSHFENIADIDKESLNGDIPLGYEFDYISLSDIDIEHFKIKTTRLIFGNAPSRARKIVRKGDILMSTVRPNLQGFSIIRNVAKDLIASTGFSVISATKCLNEYLYQYLFSQQIARQFHHLLVGSNYPAINSSDVKKLLIALPPLPEQKAIAHLLGLMDTAINKNNQFIVQKELRKKWLMQNLLTGKKRLKGFKDRWKEYKFGEILKEVKRTIEFDDNAVYNLISVRRNSGGIFRREQLLGGQILVKDLRAVKPGDFLFSKMQILHGASALVTKEFTDTKISGSYIVVIAKDSKILNMDYFNWYSKTPYFYYQTFVSSYGVAIEKMTFEFDYFLKLTINLPSIKEQTAIANLLQAVDKEIQLLKAKTEKLREQKKWLMQVLLTGKKRLKLNNSESKK